MKYYNLLALLSTTISNLSANGQILELTPVEGTDGLCSPRKLTKFKKEIYIAESGTGAEVPPTDPASESSCAWSAPSFSYSCIGSTSRVSKFKTKKSKGSKIKRRSMTSKDTRKTPKNKVKKVIGDLFSSRPLSGTGETHATGAQQVAFWKKKIFTVTGLGLNGTTLTMNGIDEEYGNFGSILKGKHTEVVAEPWKSEFENNYDGSSDPTGVLPVPDSNPYHLHISGDKFYVVDAGCNCMMTYESLNEVSATEPSRVMTFPKFEGLDALSIGPCTAVTPPYGPPFCGTYNIDGNWYYDVESVPTSVYKRPKYPNKIYVSTLAGAIWNNAVAVIYEIDLDEDGYPIEDSMTQVGDSTFYAIVDMAFYGQKNLYVLESMLGFTPFIGGRLSKINMDDGTTTIVETDGMIYNPSGIVIDKNTIYISNNTHSGASCDGHIISGILPKRKKST